MIRSIKYPDKYPKPINLRSPMHFKKAANMNDNKPL